MADQLATVDYSDAGTPDVTAIGYDGLGRRTSQTDSTGATVTWVWDSLGRLASTSDSSGAVSYTYDLAGNVASLTYPGGVTEDVSFVVEVR